MHREPQQNPRRSDPPPHHGPQQRHDHDAQQPLRASPRADGRHHRVQQPNTRELQRPLRAHPHRRAQHPHHQPARDDVPCREGHLAEGEPQPVVSGAPCRRQQEPGEQGRVPVGVSVVGRPAARDEACRVREDIVVDVGVFRG